MHRLTLILLLLPLSLYSQPAIIAPYLDTAGLESSFLALEFDTVVDCACVDSVFDCQGDTCGWSCTNQECDTSVVTPSFTLRWTGEIVFDFYEPTNTPMQLQLTAGYYPCLSLCPWEDIPLDSLEGDLLAAPGHDLTISFVATLEVTSYGQNITESDHLRLGMVYYTIEVVDSAWLEDPDYRNVSASVVVGGPPVPDTAVAGTSPGTRNRQALPLRWVNPRPRILALDGRFVPNHLAGSQPTAAGIRIVATGNQTTHLRVLLPR